MRQTRRVVAEADRVSRPNLPLFYLDDVVMALIRDDFWVGPADYWTGPCDPREATILLGSAPVATDERMALVWDEETGFRIGGFVCGRAGYRTRLRGQRYICYGVLPDPADVIDCLLDIFRRQSASPWWRTLWPWWRPIEFGSRRPVVYRGFRDDDDFDGQLMERRP